MPQSAISDNSPPGRSRISTSSRYSLNIISDSGQVEPKWDTLITQKTTDAQQEVTATMLGKGLTIAQINTWDSPLSVHLDLAAWMVLREIFSVLSADEVDLTRFDHLNRMEAIRDPLYIPATSAGASVDGDTYDDVTTPVFAFDRGDDPDDHEMEFERPKDIIL